MPSLHRSPAALFSYEFLNRQRKALPALYEKETIPTCSLSVHWVNPPAPELHRNSGPALHFSFPLLWWLSGADLAQLLSLLPSKSQHIWSPAVASTAQLSTAKMPSSESCNPMEMQRSSFIWIRSLYLCVDFTSHSQRQRAGELAEFTLRCERLYNQHEEDFHRKTSSFLVTNLNFC